MDMLKSCASGLEKIGAPSLRNHDGKESRPVAVGRRRSSALERIVQLSSSSRVMCGMVYSDHSGNIGPFKRHAGVIMNSFSCSIKLSN